MTITYNLGPQHKWRFYYPSSYGDLAETPLVGGLIYTYESMAHTTPKATYSSNSGSPPPANTNPIVLDANGECVVYLAFDDTLTNLENEYYIEVRDPNGVLIDSFDMYNTAPLPNGAPTPGTDENANNYIKNPQFYWNHFAKSSGFKLSNAIASPTLYNGTYISDEWTFTKNNSQATETVTLIPFSAGQTQVPFQPVNYIEWSCTGAGTTETFKNIFQSIPGSQSFSTQTIWIAFWAKSSTASALTVNFRQYFGSGGSADVVSPILQQPNIANQWTFYASSLVVPSTSGQTINAGDLVQIEFALPINISGTIDLSNIALTIGTTAPTASTFPYESNSETLSKIFHNIFVIPTAETKTSFNLTVNNPGWISLNNGTIGNVASTATSFASENAWPLFNYLWTNVSNTYCPVLPSGRGASAIADFDANQTIGLPSSLDRFTVAAGDLYALGQVGGSTAISTSNLPAHSHTFGGGSRQIPDSNASWQEGNATGGAEGNIAFVGSSDNIGSISATDNTGSGTDYLPPYLAQNNFIKL